jgi:uncharacterized phage protein (TIGR02220 family)
MPNRVIREGIITSVPVNLLSWGAEVFYRRLLNVADDYGRFHGNPSLLRAYCYPLQLNKVSDSDIAKWLAETRKAGLVRVYSHDGKEIVEVDKFGQRVRAEKTKFPLPSDISPTEDGQLSDNGQTAAHVVEDGVVVEDEVKASSGKPDLKPQAVEILNFLNAKTGKNFLPVAANLEMIIARLREGYPCDDIRSVVARKCGEWKADEKMAPYLRPKTLFSRTNFANYHGQLAQVSHEK